MTSQRPSSGDLLRDFARTQPDTSPAYKEAAELQARWMDRVDRLLGEGTRPDPAKRLPVGAKRTGDTPHKKLIKACVKAIKKRWPDARIIVRNVALVEIKDTRPGHRGEVRKIALGRKGEADIDVVLNGRAIAVECKALETKDKQRDSQEKYEKRFTDAGGHYGIANSPEDAIRICQSGIGELPI